MKRPRRNAFNLSYESKLTLNMGELVPIMCMPVVPALKKKLESMNYYLATSVGQTVLNVAVFALSSILLVNATNNPFIYWQF